MKKHQKILIAIFGIMLISNFLEWLKFPPEAQQQLNSISALDILNLTSYKPLLLGFIAPLAGIYFAFKNNKKLLFYTSLAGILNAINFYFLIITPAEGAFNMNNPKMVIQHSISFGFYLFTIASVIAVFLTAKDSGFLTVNAKKSENSDTNSVVNVNQESNQIEDPVASISDSKTSASLKIKLKKSHIIIATIIAALVAGIFLYRTLTKISEIKIGGQIWATKNLDVSTFRNGDPIQEVKTSSEWEKANNDKKAAWCYYEFNQTNKIFGKLYNFFAVVDKRGLAPTGWHIPSKDEWEKLVVTLGGEYVAGGELAKKSRGEFGALPGGNGGLIFQGIDKYCVWWSSLKLKYQSDMRLTEDGHIVPGTWDATSIDQTADLVTLDFETNKTSITEIDGSYRGNYIRCIKGEESSGIKIAVADTTTSRPVFAPVVDTAKKIMDTTQISIVDTTQKMMAQTTIDTSINKNYNDFKSFIGTINVAKTFFYDSSNLQTIRKGFLVENQELSVEKEDGNFYYGIYTSPKGIIAKGWLLKKHITKK